MDSGSQRRPFLPHVVVAYTQYTGKPIPSIAHVDGHEHGLQESQVATHAHFLGNSKSVRGEEATKNEAGYLRDLRRFHQPNASMRPSQPTIHACVLSCGRLGSRRCANPARDGIFRTSVSEGFLLSHLLFLCECVVSHPAVALSQRAIVYSQLAQIPEQKFRSIRSVFWVVRCAQRVLGWAAVCMG